MQDNRRTKAQLLSELAELRQRVTELEAVEAGRKTLQAKSEEALRASETRYRRLFETARDGILILDADTGQITDANPFLVEMLGYARKEFLGKELWELGPFKDVAASKAAFLELQSKGYVRYEDLPLETRDGRRIDVEFVSNIYLVDHKQVIQCNIRDVTERKRAEEVLRESEQKYRILLEESSDPIFTFNPDGQYRYVNKAFADGVGKKREEIIGKKIWDVFPKDEADKRYATVKWVFENGETKVIEVRVPRPDGDRYYLTTVKPILNDQGKVISVICTSKEITERKQVEASLQKHALQLRTAAEVSRIASSILNLDELLPQVVELIHDRFNLYYVGLFLVDETGQHTVLRAGTGEAGHKMFAAGHILKVGDSSMIGWCIAHSQARIALDVGEEAIRFSSLLLPQTRSEMALPLVSRGCSIGAMTIQSDQPAAFSQEDITVLQTMADQLANAIENARLFEQAQREIAERKQAEEALGQSNTELQARNEELDAYAHTVAHDLNNPVALIMGHAEVLSEYYTTMSDDQRQRSLQTVVRGGRKMKSIIEELLLLSQVHKMQVGGEPLDMERVVAEALQGLANMVEQYQADIRMSPGWTTALGYAPWVEAVWANYISNAIKYGGRPPHIELGATAQDDGMVRFWVRDNGAGLTPEEQTRLFIPFTRLDQVRVKGHGLGLSIVRRIVEKLGGQVGVESQVGQGSVFSFTLPGCPVSS